MALTTTTLNGAITSSAQSMIVTSATSFVAGNFVQIDQEIVRIGKSYVSGTTIPLSARGLSGTVASAHVTGANATTGSGSDFASAGPQVAVPYPVAGRARTLTSYSATGALTLPTPGTDAVAILNGTSALAMTLAVPTKDMDGCLFMIVGNGKSASTVTFATAIGNAGAGYTVLTMQTGGATGFMLMAINGLWLIVGAPPITGTSTAVSLAIS